MPPRQRTFAPDVCPNDGCLRRTKYEATIASAVDTTNQNWKRDSGLNACDASTATSATRRAY